MKILFFIDCLSSGGKERRLTELMKALKISTDIDFELAIMSHDIHFKEILDFNIPIHYLIRKTKKDLSVFKDLYKLCKSIKPDLIHCWDNMTAVYSSVVCKQLNIPLVNGMVTNTLRNHNLFNKYWFRAKLTFPFSDYIVGNSFAGMKSYNAPPKRSRVIYNGFNFGRISKIQAKETILSELNISTKYSVCMVASFSKNKDYNTYFQAAQLVLKSRNDVTFLAIGSRTDSILAKSLISKSNEQNFRLLGLKSGVESYVNAMDICILSTFTEGISNSILEYMALGKPVVATSGGGTDELIVNATTGYLVSPSDVNGMAEKILVLLENENLRESMGKAGNKRVHTMFSIEKMLSTYVALYQEIAAKVGKH